MTKTTFAHAACVGEGWYVPEQSSVEIWHPFVKMAPYRRGGDAAQVPVVPRQVMTEGTHLPMFASDSPQGTSSRLTKAALWCGLILTGVVTVFPFLNRSVLADHIRSGYPSYTSGEVNHAVDLYLVILATAGVVGIVGWLATIWAVRSGKGWIRWVAPVLLVGAIAFALTGLTVRDTSGDVGLAPMIGWLQMLPAWLAAQRSSCFGGDERHRPNQTTA
jgi:hypothetical protein